MTRTFSTLTAIAAFCVTAVAGTANAQNYCAPCNPCDPGYTGNPVYPAPTEGEATGDMVLPPTMQSQPAAAPPPTALASLGAGAGVGGGASGGDALLGGYIDPAVVATRFRFRFDHAEGGDSDRAEFLYAAYDVNAALGAAGFVQDPAGDSDVLISNLDYEEISFYFEYAVIEWFSLFAEIPVRFTDISGQDIATAATVSDVENSGLGDVVGGFRVALIANETTHITFQFKVDTASGDPGFALGNGNTSLIPGFLFQHQCNELVTIFGEIHGYIPLNGATLTANGRVPGDTGDHFGSVLRYGIGGSVLLLDHQAEMDHQLYWINEFVAWDFLGGLKTTGTNFGTANIVDAEDDFIVNYKTGLRYNVNQRHSFYGGWGTALTSDDLYDDIFRFEYALTY
jgi:hypothetical protein